VFRQGKRKEEHGETGTAAEAIFSELESEMIRQQVIYNGKTAKIGIK
jgi:hypothetical protein